MKIQVYCALIASVLLVLWTGQRPAKRQGEALQLYWLGWASLEELTRVMVPRKKTERVRRGLVCAQQSPGRSFDLPQPADPSPAFFLLILPSAAGTNTLVDPLAHSLPITTESNQ